MFRKIASILIAGMAVFGLCGSAFAQEGGGAGERIISFDAAAKIDADRMVTVTESINYDFGIMQKHGIYRVIPEAYQRNGGSYRLHLKIVSVFMDGKEAPYRVTTRTPDLTIRIGDSNRTIMGVHLYQIVYKTDRAINSFNDHDELYWNATGDGWQVPIEKASFSVRGPQAFDAKATTEACFVGSYGSTSRDCEIKNQGDTIRYEASRMINPGEGMTIVTAFPKGMVKELSVWDRVGMFIADNWIAVLPILVFVFMLRYWMAYGREPKGKGTIVPQYEPPRGLTPMEMSVMEFQSMKPRTVSATIIDLARRGYLKINYTKKKGLFGDSDSYSFTKLKKGDDLSPHESDLFEGMFAEVGDVQDLERLKGEYYTSIKDAEKSVYSVLREKGLFGRNPVSVRAQWFAIAFAVLFFGFFFSIASGKEAVWFISIMLSALIIGIFGWFMPQKTVEGAVALEEIEGFKWFLSVTEKDRLNFHNAPALKPEQFHEFLSYAIAFGVEEQWAKQFKDLTIPQPQYISGYGPMDPIIFAHSMHAFDSRFTSVAAMPPRSSGAGGGFSGMGGGGFSGGGFGGGGGGSW